MALTIDDQTHRLAVAIDAAGELLDTLQRLMAEPDGSGPATGTIGRHPPESKEPWSPPAAHAYWAIYHGARGLANIMREAVGMRPKRDGPYGYPALLEIGNLAPSVSTLVLRTSIRMVETWVDQARQVPAIDESEPWANVPQIVGAQPPRCPYCQTFGLRMQRRAGRIACFFPGCVDSEGDPTRARMESGRMTGESRLVFGDGTMMHFREAS